MAAMTQMLLKQLGKNGLSQIGQQIGADQKQTSTALSAIMPTLVSALAKNASSQEGAGSLLQALTNDHDGSILDDITGFLGNSSAANGAGILGHILGNKQTTVTQGLSKGTGLDFSQISKLLQLAAPLVMGLLGKTAQKKSLDTDGLSTFLGGQQKKAQKSNPMMGALNSLLDADGDGSALDDILGMAGKLFGKR